jgi:hypothetical protein
VTSLRRPGERHIDRKRTSETRERTLWELVNSATTLAFGALSNLSFRAVFLVLWHGHRTCY